MQVTNYNQYHGLKSKDSEEFILNPRLMKEAKIIVNDLNELEYSLSNQFLLFSFYFSLFSFSNRIMKIG